jgi:hypothetical protein
MDSVELIGVHQHDNSIMIAQRYHAVRHAEKIVLNGARRRLRSG